MNFKTDKGENKYIRNSAHWLALIIDFLISALELVRKMLK